MPLPFSSTLLAVAGNVVVKDRPGHSASDSVVSGSENGNMAPVHGERPLTSTNIEE